MIQSIKCSNIFYSSDDGPPHNGDMSTKSVISGSKSICGNGWVCYDTVNQLIFASRKIIANM